MPFVGVLEPDAELRHGSGGRSSRSRPRSAFSLVGPCSPEVVPVCRARPRTPGPAAWGESRSIHRATVAPLVSEAVVGDQRPARTGSNGGPRDSRPRTAGEAGGAGEPRHHLQELALRACAVLDRGGLPRCPGAELGIARAHREVRRRHPRRSSGGPPVHADLPVDFFHRTTSPRGGGLPARRPYGSRDVVEQARRSSSPATAWLSPPTATVAWAVASAIAFGRERRLETRLGQPTPNCGTDQAGGLSVGAAKSFVELQRACAGWRQPLASWRVHGAAACRGAPHQFENLLCSSEAVLSAQLGGVAAAASSNRPPPLPAVARPARAATRGAARPRPSERPRPAPRPRRTIPCVFAPSPSSLRPAPPRAFGSRATRGILGPSLREPAC